MVGLCADRSGAHAGSWRAVLRIDTALSAATVWALASIASVCAATLAAVYVRPREPETGIGVAAGNTGKHPPV